MIVGVGSAQGIIDSRRRLQENQGIELQIAIDPEVIDAMTVPPGEVDDDEVDDDSTVVESYEDEDAVTADAGMSAQQTSQNAETETMSAKFLKVTCLHLLNNRQS